MLEAVQEHLDRPLPQRAPVGGGLGGEPWLTMASGIGARPTGRSTLGCSMARPTSAAA
jgi:hypothetical protein